MTNPAFDDARDEKPLDPAVEKVRRKMLRLLFVSIGIMMIGLMAVLVAIVYRTGDRKPQPAAPGMEIPFAADGAVLEGRILVPAGAEVLSQSISGTRLALLVALAGGGRSIIVYDMRENRVVGRFAVASE